MHHLNRPYSSSTNSKSEQETPSSTANQSLSGGVGPEATRKMNPPLQPSYGPAHDDADALEDKPPNKRRKASICGYLHKGTGVTSQNDNQALFGNQECEQLLSDSDEIHTEAAAVSDGVGHGSSQGNVSESKMLQETESGRATTVFGRAKELEAGMEVQLVELCCASGFSMVRTLLLESLLGKGGYAMVWQAKQMTVEIQQGFIASHFQQNRASTTTSSSSSSTGSSKSSSWPQTMELGRSFAVKVGYGYGDLAEKDQEAVDDENQFMSVQYNSLEKEDRICTKGVPHPGVVRTYGWGELLLPATVNHSESSGQEQHQQAKEQDLPTAGGVLPALLLEVMHGGSLLSYLRRNGGLLGNQALAKELLKQIIDALMHLESRKIVHRDLKCSNILLDTAGHTSSTSRGGMGGGDSPGGTGYSSGDALGSGMQIKLSDFGTSLELKPGGSMGSSRIGTLEFLPPEMLMDLGMFHDQRVNTYQVRARRACTKILKAMARFTENVLEIDDGLYESMGQHSMKNVPVSIAPDRVVRIQAHVMLSRQPIIMSSQVHSRFGLLLAETKLAGCNVQRGD
jgi:hypothetical protein